MPSLYVKFPHENVWQKIYFRKNAAKHTLFSYVWMQMDYSMPFEHYAEQ